MRLFLPLLALLAVLTACAAQPGAGAGGSPSPSGGRNDGVGDDPGGNALVIEIDRGDGSVDERYALTCGAAPGGDHPAAHAACDHLRGMDDPFAPLPADAVCTQVFDGPQSAHVTGVWQGRPVDVRLARNDGCRIAQWDAFGPLLPAAPG